MRTKDYYPDVHATRIDTLHAAAGLLVSGGKDQKVVIPRLEDMERVATLNLFSTTSVSIRFVSMTALSQRAPKYLRVEVAAQVV